ncbi:MAG: 3-oxoacyl-ACP synthase III family protein [Deltaproteobacteria bacterium]|nr:3-oxoacyl-ACP synthase III family protein [Deltaproteobacteria bacterium]
MGNIIIGTGAGLPQTVVTNEDIEKKCRATGFDPAKAKGMSMSEWGRRVIGSDKRRMATNESSADLLLTAATEALDDAGIDAKDINLIITSTATDDHEQPNLAHTLQARLGAENLSHAIGLNESCPGFIKALHIADAMMTHYREYKNVLIGVGDRMSSIIGTDFIPLLTFGDAFAAVVLTRMDDGADGYGIISSFGKSDGKNGPNLALPKGGTLQMNHKAVKGFAMNKLEESARYVLTEAGLTTDDISYIAPHQAGRFVIKNSCERLNIKTDKKILTHFKEYANTSQASIPLLLHENKKRFKDKDIIVMTTCGGGLSWGGVVYRWYVK